MKRQIQTTEAKTDTSTALIIGFKFSLSLKAWTKQKSRYNSRSGNIDAHHTEQPEFNNEGKVDQNAEQCHDIRPLPAKLLRQDN
ncbi:hypothetical protein Tco_0653495 [Tanacetum coccineum]|uniref:Uncharacterized protein n=1 Tax=Tanacetum coccineum TaxID=301880 RepID=A0ABQ4X1C2_9ASTR